MALSGGHHIGELGGRLGTPAIAVAALTALGFAVRLAGFDQSLFADELSTYASVTIADGPGEVVDLIRADDERIATGEYVIELTPPGYFVLAWLAAQGDKLAGYSRQLAAAMTLPHLEQRQAEAAVILDKIKRWVGYRA